jgi:hypothetical protein
MLKIHGRRLDASAPPLRSHIPAGFGNVGFQATALIFPAPGCWEVSGQIAGARLTVCDESHQGRQWASRRSMNS